MRYRLWGAALVWAATSVASAAIAQQDAARVYFFGNSLVNHVSDESDHTNVPYWMDQMARAGGRSFAMNGQWGFLRNFADGVPPVPNWSLTGVTGLWPGSAAEFRSEDFDAVIVAPSNFIQYQLPDVPYDGENPTGDSPLNAFQRLLDWLVVNSPGSRLFVYEGWSSMDGHVSGFPPSQQEADAYQAHNAGEYHQWFEDLLNVLEVTRPEAEVRLIPVASLVARFVSDGGVLESLPADALYTDTAPHGTPTLYLLAAMITYAWVYDAPPPVDFRPPATLHPDLVAHYAELAQAIGDALPRREARAPTPGPAETAEVSLPDLPVREPVALPPRGAVPDGAPALGMGFSGPADWSTQHPFLDRMKLSRGWVGNIGDTWGAVSHEDLRAGGHLDEHGWPLRMPEGVDALESVLLTYQPKEADSLRGDYVLTYEGTGTLNVLGRASRVRRAPGRVTFHYEPGDGLVAISITEIDPQDPIRDIVVLHEDHVALYEAGALFNPDFLDRVENLRAVRFMDWMMTNGSPVASWADRPRIEDATWTVRGVPAEVMIRLANVIGADPWFNMPHRADDEYVRRFAELVQRDLDPRLKAYVEYSNEIWNRIFPQATWAGEQAEALWGASEQGWLQYYGLRAAQVMDLWAGVFGDEAETRVVRVVATHTGWPTLEENILSAPLAFLQLGRMPVESFDAYAVTGYFGYELGGEAWAQRMDGWLDAAEKLAEEAGKAQGLQRVALREYVRTRRFEGAIAPVAQALAEGALHELVEEIFPYHAGVARKHGLQLVMYEGGTHLVGHGARVDDERLADFFTMFNYTPEMAKLYEVLLGGWTDAGGTLFNAFVDVAPPSKWGSWGALRYLEDSNPRWDMLMAYNASGPTGWENRDNAGFANGIRVLGGGGDQRITGTAEEDYLLGGPGDDVLVSAGGADVLHGGPGQDRVVLPGAREDYDFKGEDRVILAHRAGGAVRMRAVEEVVFDSAPEVVTPLAELLR